jgi:hypothetical protein
VLKEKDLKWPNMDTILSDNKRLKGNDKNSHITSPTCSKNHEQKKTVTFANSS